MIMGTRTRIGARRLEKEGNWKRLYLHRRTGGPEGLRFEGKKKKVLLSCRKREEKPGTTAFGGRPLAVTQTLYIHDCLLVDHRHGHVFVTFARILVVQRTEPVAPEAVEAETVSPVF